MKECPQCHRRYDDSMNFCTLDGHQLELIVADSVERELQEAKPICQPAPQKNNQPHKNQIKKNVGITLGALAIVVFTFFHYYKNASTYICTEPTEVCMPKCGGESIVHVQFDGYVWKIGSYSEWINLSKIARLIKINNLPNLTGQILEGFITVNSGKQSTIIKVLQNAHATFLYSDEKSIKFNADGGAKEISISTDGCALNYSSPNWVTIKNENEKLLINCAPNAGMYRSGNIVLYEDNLSLNISITQGGICNQCNGQGKYKCTWCGGTGRIGPGLSSFTLCPVCKGDGICSCRSCNGTGTLE